RRNCEAGFRLAAVAAVGNQREPTAPRERNSVPITDRVGAISLADYLDFSRASAAVALDRRSVIRTPAPPPSRSGSEPPHGRAGAHEPQRSDRPDVSIDRPRNQPAAWGHRDECGHRIALASKGQA